MAKATETKPTDSDKIAMIVAVLKANGFTLPDGLDDSAPVDTAATE